MVWHAAQLTSAEACALPGQWSRLPFSPGSDIRQTHLSFGNQNFLTMAPSVEVTSDYWGTQLKWLEQLGTSATSQAAQAAIQQGRLIDGMLFGTGPINGVDPYANIDLD
mgnify:CR=1 FL=1